MTGNPKMGDKHCDIIVSDISHMETMYNIHTITWVMDNGPDHKHACSLLSKA